MSRFCTPSVVLAVYRYVAAGLTIAGPCMTDSPKIIIAEDHDLFRSTVVKELKRLGIDVLAEVSNGRHLLELLETLQPDIVLLDLEMPEMDGNMAFSAIKEKFPRLKIIVLSQYTDNGLMENYRARGADGFLAKNFVSGDIDILAREIRVVKNEGKSFYLADPEAKRLKFSKREVEIIPLLCKGETSKEIANRLGIGEKAINKHRKELYKKTNTRNSAEFIYYALKRGLDFLGGLK
jgi:DNA-binding NarL/FixJ family response regulator